MLPGYNHNICYKGQIFHIQTEDSGLERPHIITLLYIKGNIIGRKKKDYEDVLGFDRIEDVVRELMQEQHKSMLKDLKNGSYDQYLTMGGGPTAEDQEVCQQPAAAPQAPPAEAPPPEAGQAPLPPPPPPPSSPEAQIEEKPATKTINLSEDAELKDEDIFGKDLISDKSLDDVILGFLAQSMDSDDDDI